MNFRLIKLKEELFLTLLKKMEDIQQENKIQQRKYEDHINKLQEEIKDLKTSKIINNTNCNNNNTINIFDFIFIFIINIYSFFVSNKIIMFNFNNIF